MEEDVNQQPVLNQMEESHEYTASVLCTSSSMEAEVVNIHLDNIAAKMSMMNVTDTIVDIGEHKNGSFIAVEESVYQNWLETLKSHCGILFRLKKSNRTFRILNSRLLLSTIEDFNPQALTNLNRLIPTLPAIDESLDIYPNIEDTVIVLSEEKGGPVDLVEQYVKSITEKFISDENAVKEFITYFTVPGVAELANIHFFLEERIIDIVQAYTHDSSVLRRFFAIYLPKKYQLFAIKDNSPIVMDFINHKNSIATNTDVASSSVKNSFKREYERLARILQSFLTYLSRHYIVSNNFLDESGLRKVVVEYYSPLTCIHQSSGAGKSRLSNEISPFILPISLSMENITGVPKESKLFQEFCKFLLSLDKQPHFSCLMNVTQVFFQRLVYFGIVEMLKEVGCSIDKNDKISGFTLEKMRKFFLEPIQTHKITVNILAGLPEFVSRHGSKRIQGINLNIPSASVFEPIAMPGYGDISAERVMHVLDQLRDIRVKFLKDIYDRPNSAAELRWLPHVLFLLDEAQHLLGVKVKEQAVVETNPNKSIPCFDYNVGDPTFKNDVLTKTDVFRVIRRTLGFSDLNWKYLWGVTISTNTSITNFTPKLTDDPSLRYRKHAVLIPPFILSETYDVFAESYIKITQPDTPDEGVHYLFSWKRMHDILSCGRPLYYSFVECYVEEPEWNVQLSRSFFDWDPKVTSAFQSLYGLIQQKLSGGNEGVSLDGDNTSLTELDLVYALLSSSIGLYGCPSVISKDDLVRRRMGWIVEANTEEDGIKVDFPAEGIFNIYAGYLIVKKFHTFVKNSPKPLIFFSKPATQKTFSTWQVTEILCRMLFLFGLHEAKPVMFRSRRITEFDLNLYSPRCLVTFLSQFADSDVVRNFIGKLGTEFYESFTYFGYFQECYEALDPVIACKSMLYRGSARYLPKQHPGADFMLPLVMGDGRYGIILIQVKGRETNFLDNPNEAIKEMEKCTVFGVFGMNTEDARLSETERKRRKGLQKTFASFPTIRILINLSTCGGSPHNGSCVVTDEHSSFLVIQSDGNNLKCLKNLDLRKFFASTINLAGESVEGKISVYEAQRREPPITLSGAPFNPVFRGLYNDNDLNAFWGTREDIESSRPKPDPDLIRLMQANRPKFEDIKKPSRS